MKFLVWLGMTMLLAFGGAVVVISAVPNYSPSFNGTLALTVFVFAPVVSFLIFSLILDHNTKAERRGDSKNNDF